MKYGISCLVLMIVSIAALSDLFFVSSRLSRQRALSCPTCVAAGDGFRAQVRNQPLMMDVADVPGLLEDLVACNQSLDVVEKGERGLLGAAAAAAAAAGGSCAAAARRPEGLCERDRTCATCSARGERAAVASESRSWGVYVPQLPIPLLPTVPAGLPTAPLAQV
jgi:hypothetical protein